MEVLLGTLHVFSPHRVKSPMGHIFTGTWLFLDIKACRDCSFQAEPRYVLEMGRGSLAAVQQS